MALDITVHSAGAALVINQLIVEPLMIAFNVVMIGEFLYGLA
jgi:hypothetical protein